MQFDILRFDYPFDLNMLEAKREFWRAYLENAWLTDECLQVANKVEDP